MRLSAFNTDSAQGERYRSSEFVLMITFCFLLFKFRGLIFSIAMIERETSIISPQIQALSCRMDG